MIYRDFTIIIFVPRSFFYVIATDRIVTDLFMADCNAFQCAFLFERDQVVVSVHCVPS